MQEMFREHHALQCGFCTPGMVMSAIDLVQMHPEGLSEEEIRHGLEGNLCRCTGYHNIVKAIAAAWPLMHGKTVQQAARISRARSATGRGPARGPGEDSMGFEGIGASVRRKEDMRFLSGRGHYVDDINRPGQLYACIKRSDRPHAPIARIDTDGRQERARRGRGLYRHRHAGGRRGRRALRVADPQQGRLADGRARRIR